MSAEPIHAAKTVQLIPKDSAIKRVCFDETTQSLRPNLVLVDRQGAVVFEINELGLKGAARDPTRRLAVVWGDSVVFGVRWSWPCLIDELAPGWQFLNGGIEADPYHNILRRAAAFNRAHDVALNIVMLGWHPLDPAVLAERETGKPRGWLQRLFGSGDPGRVPDRNPTQRNSRIHDDLKEFLVGTPNTVLATMPTALNRTLVDRDLSLWFRGGGRDEVFRFGGDVPYTLRLQRYMFEHIEERNRMVREIAAATGARLVDLAAVFDTERRGDFREDFFDVLHLRPRAYPKVAAAVYAGIKDLL